MNRIKCFFSLTFIVLSCTLLSFDCFGQGKVMRTTGQKVPQTEQYKTSNPKTQTQTVGSTNGHEWVNLGLPSGIKWATCNVGASSPSEYGNYYAWGEIKEKTDYNETNCLTYKKPFDDISGNPSFDVSQSLWGSEWNLPTREDLGEIEAYCKWKWIKYKGVYGIKLVGPNGKSIFLPAPRLNQWNQFVGDYWLSEPIGKMFGTDNTSAWSISISKDTMVKGISNTAQAMHYRYSGQMIRPVSRQCECNQTIIS